jgi:hypothetical protein
MSGPKEWHLLCSPERLGYASEAQLTSEENYDVPQAKKQTHFY